MQNEENDDLNGAAELTMQYFRLFYRSPCSHRAESICITSWPPAYDDIAHALTLLSA